MRATGGLATTSVVGTSRSWPTTCDHSKTRICSEMVSLLVTGSSGLALSFSPYDGKIIGKQTLTDSAHLPPVVANETVYILSDDARLSAFK